MKTILSVITALSIALCLNVARANERVAMLIPAPWVGYLEYPNEGAAGWLFLSQHDTGEYNVNPGLAKPYSTNGIEHFNVITPENFRERLSTEYFDVVWINIHRFFNNESGQAVREIFSQEVYERLKEFLADGGNVILTKQATQLISEISDVPAPNVFDSGEGRWDNSVFYLNAGICRDKEADYNNVISADGSEFRDYNDIFIFRDLDKEFITEDAYTYKAIPVQGSKVGTTFKSDHNSLWDLNKLGLDGVAEGRNLNEKFENLYNCTVIGTWGQVVAGDIAGMVLFRTGAESRAATDHNLEPFEQQGAILCYGLGGGVFAPRFDTDAEENNYNYNFRRLIANSLNFMAKKVNGEDPVITSADEIISDVDGETEYYNLHGQKVSGENPGSGVYICRSGNKIIKKVIK
ncbi:MAG: hypothetical protein K2G24_02700 [Muribaculaceae bacterium]|nr:hypothetical protein [Muribaculaceae bacterium]